MGVVGTGMAGIAALSLKRSLDVGSYQTVWAMLHRLRAVLVRPGRERLVGTVEVDETYIGGRDPGVGRGKGRGDKVLTGIAVEIKEPRGDGRCRLALLADASAASLRAFVTDHVEPGATVITDGWKGYLGLDRCGSTPMKRAVSARPGFEAMRRLRSCCLPSIELLHWPSGGLSAPTKVP